MATIFPSIPLALVCYMFWMAGHDPFLHDTGLKYRWDNAGTRIETRVSFDHWPMIATINPGAIDCRKHETFRITRLESDTFEAVLKLDASDATEWRRLE